MLVLLEYTKHSPRHALDYNFFNITFASVFMSHQQNFIALGAVQYKTRILIEILLLKSLAW